MKPIKITGIIILLVCTGVLLRAQESESSPVTLEKVTGSVYQLTGGEGANGGLIIGENGVLVIDSKMNEASVKQSMDVIQGITDKPIKYLVNTHSDGDHIMGNRYYPSSVTFIGHN